MATLSGFNYKAGRYPGGSPFGTARRPVTVVDRSGVVRRFRCHRPGVLGGSALQSL